MGTLCSSQLLNSHKTALLRKCSVWPSPSKKRNSKFHLMRAFAQQATLLHIQTNSELWSRNSWILMWIRFYVKWNSVHQNNAKKLVFLPVFEPLKFVSDDFMTFLELKFQKYCHFGRFRGSKFWFCNISSPKKGQKITKINIQSIKYCQKAIFDILQSWTRVVLQVC